MSMISLRDATVKDASTIYQWKTDPFLRKMALDESYQTTEEEQEEDIDRAVGSEDAEYKIILLKQQPIGYIRIDYMDEHNEMAWLRFALGKERGKGYGKIALQMYIDDLFSRGVKRIEGEVYEYNERSQKLLESVGFVKEGQKRQAHLYHKQYCDILVYGLLHEDYVT
ncbi:GNAT family N-acetyltransferase [Candidatus Xianfuyuplasma coldseepsis]|uniref:GNAT family N-acetyltransferase n=1 Tax=Candidatus Xianfuyuplasma coldseepsis TaxID=2782163 RepID=A0A7L7KS95_9MOLU|nr:GNAT family protein [Xianfuyuplasma coldseepsis]QMS85475.1 GNAT family N-acetyltransferase [Xianfuyuplasma coldseepsis]